MRQSRGIRKDNGEWLNGWYNYVAGRHTIALEGEAVSNPGATVNLADHYGDKISYNFIEVLPETVGQFIGHENIWAGDIITFVAVDSSTKKRQTASVYYCEKRLAFCAKGKAWDCPLIFCKNIKIIGDIHTTPEKLK